MITIDEMYDRLGLEDPLLFALTRMEECYHSGNKEIFRRSGKTTRTALLAIRDALNKDGRAILVRTSSVESAQHFVQTLKDLAERLGKFDSVEIYSTYPQRKLSFRNASYILVTSSVNSEREVVADRIYDDGLYFRREL